MKDWEAVAELLHITIHQTQRIRCKEIVSGFWLTFFHPLKENLKLMRTYTNVCHCINTGNFWHSKVLGKDVYKSHYLHYHHLACRLRRVLRLLQ